MGTTPSEEGTQYRRGARDHHPDHHDGPHYEPQYARGCSPSTPGHPPHVSGTATLAGHGLHGIGHDREGKPGEQRKELRLSRFNQWLPGRKAQPDVVEGTTDVHHDIADALFPEADPVFDNATALHTAVDMLDPEPSTVQGLVGPLWLQRQRLAAGASWSA
jgi:hypothetical protein